jgi:hypothetical protein
MRRRSETPTTQIDAHDMAAAKRRSSQTIGQSHATSTRSRMTRRHLNSLRRLPDDGATSESCRRYFDNCSRCSSRSGLIRDLGFDPVDAGPLRLARYLEPFSLLLAQLAYETDAGEEVVYRISQAGQKRRASKR